MIIGQITILILLVLCIYYFNDVKYVLQVRYFTKKHKRKSDLYDKERKIE